MIARIAAAALAAFLVAGPALAQTGTAMIEIADSVTVAPFSMTVDQLDDMDVHDPSGEKIGEVEEVLGTDAASPTALVVDFESDAGYPDRDVIVPIGRFTLEDNRLFTEATPAEVAAFDTWDD